MYFYLSIVFPVLFLAYFFLKKKKTYNLDELNKKQIIERCYAINWKPLDYKYFKQKLAKIDIKSEKILPMCIEMIEKIQNKFPNVSIWKKICSFFKIRKFKISRITVKKMESFMESEMKSFEDFSDLRIFSNFKQFSGKFNNNQITIDEFKESFKKGGNIKHDFMKLSKIHLYYIPNYLKQVLINKFNEILFGNDITQISEHALGINYLIYKVSKQGPIDEISSYRTITTIPVIINFFHRILSLRISEYVLQTHKIINTNIHKGSIPGIKYPVLEQIIKVKNVVRSSSDTNKPYMMFVDITNAFPSLNIVKLLTLLEFYNIDSNIIEYIRAFYENFESKTIISRKSSTKLMPWKQGLIQGCPMSPILFVIVMNYITYRCHRKFLNKHGYTLHGYKILFTAYLDDIVIIANSKNGLIEVFKEIQKLFSSFDLNINVSKTKIMCNNNEEVIIPGIENVSNITYLGETIELDLELKYTYKKVFKSLFNKLYKLDKGGLTNDKKLYFFKKSVIPFLQRKFIVNYDFSLEKKQNLLKVMNYFSKKWGIDNPDIKVNGLYDVMSESEDHYITQILFSEETTKFDTDLETLIEYDYKLIKYNFKY